MNDASASDSARNLLFGLLAFQNNFINRRELLAAFDTRTADKSRPLGRILADQGAISNDLLALITGLVSAHLAKHNDEPEKSLAALTPIGSVREDLEGFSDLRLTLTHVSGTDLTVSHHGSVGAASSAGVRFKILRPLNRGGMGVVSVALDTELDRSIALKEIRDTAADDDAYRARFLVEAEITGKLEHPGIIPIYGLGTYADGRPFYAMRLIRGDKTGSLTDAIRRFYAEPDPASRVVEFRGLLRRFLDVCNAIAYAHSKGVLHRDLKPDNILLGPYGETLVVDWGLAKAAGRADPGPSDGEQVRLNLSGSGLSPTIAGGAFGTPEYAPPEQMTGDLPNVGPRSDVYGLGAILYCLMTGQAPFSRQGIDLGKLIKKIEEGDFPPPRQLRSEIDKPLEAICLKAMSRKPSDRYETVRALATDMESYLADEPVSSYREPWTLRVRRWTRRHRTLVSTAAASLVMALVGLGGMAVIQTKARNDLAVKNTALNRANSEVTKANIELVATNSALDRERIRAESRESQAIEGVERFSASIENEPALKNSIALKELRRRLLGEPVAFFRGLRDQLQADAKTRPKSLEMLSTAAYRHAYLSHEIGNREEAVKSFDECLAILERLAQEHPAEPRYRSKLGLAHSGLGVVQMSIGQPRKARDSIEKGAALYTALLRDAPDRPDDQRGLARCQLMIGVLEHRQARHGPAIDWLRKACDGFERLLPLAKDPSGLRAELAMCHLDIGAVEAETGRFPDALADYGKALGVLDRLVSENPNVAAYQLDQGRTYLNIGKIQTFSGKKNEAEAALTTARKIFEILVRDYPAVSEYQSNLATSFLSLSQVAATTGRPADAEAHLAKARAAFERLAAEHPESPDFASELGAIIHNLGEIQHDAKNFLPARDLLLEALTWQRKALAANPQNPRFRECMNAHLTILAQAAAAAGDGETAEIARQELARLVTADPAKAGLDRRLTEVAKGEKPKDQAERLALAQRAQETRQTAAAARLWAEALAADPKLGDDRAAQYRYNASCAASLAGSGQGKDDPKPDDPAKAKLRAQALGWLKDELSAWDKVASTAGPGDKELVAKTLDHWKQDADLAGVRDADALAKLPEAEHKDWQALWAEVDSLLAKVANP